MPLDPQARFVLDQLAVQGGFDLTALSPAEARDAFEKMRLPLPVEPVARVENRSIPGPAGAIPVRVYAADGIATPAPALVYFHGGGWVIGSLETHDPFCRALANRTGAVVVSVDYRLAPEARYPAAAEDCYAVTRWIAEHGAELGIDGTRLAVGGDSAGGNLAAAVGLMARDRKGPALRHQLLIYPVTDADFATASYRDNADGYMLTRDVMQWFWNHYVPDAGQRRDAYAAPLRAVDLSGLPPATVQTAEFDPLRDEGEAYAKRLQGAGIATTLTRYDGQIHGFAAMFEIFDAGKRALEESSAALRKALA
jgi:acetyl esterase